MGQQRKIRMNKRKEGQETTRMDHLELPVNEIHGVVLVVEDELKSRELLREVLASAGHKVTEAVNGHDALERVRKAPPDTVLLDVMMPGMDGYEVCARLKRDPYSAHIPVIMVTALSEREDLLRGIASGADDFLNKPIDHHELKLRVRNALYAKHLFDRVRENYRKLQEMERQWETLTHMVIHDLKQPITAISGYLQLIAMKTETLGDAKLHGITNTAQNVLASLLRMIESILDIHKLEEGKLALDKKSGDLVFLVDEVVQSLESRLKKYGYSEAFSDNEMVLSFDQGLIKRVLLNLLENAMKHTPHGNIIKIAVADEGSLFRISVTDRGSGISKEYHHKIFEKFGQVEMEAEGKARSTGLGLTFCKLAVEAHGGEIGVESAPGKGSTFWFTLPVD
jgi:signal transduction histidine kinase